MKKLIILIIIFIAVYGLFVMYKKANSRNGADEVILTVDPINSDFSNISSSTESEQIIDISSTTTPSQQLEPTIAVSNTEPVKIVVPNPKPIVKEIPKTQIVRATITEEEGLVPYIFTLKVGVPARFEVTSEVDVEGCMSTILIPELYDEPSLVKAGEKIVMEFTPKKEGEYYITCVMGIEWGVINVVK